MSVESNSVVRVIWLLYGSMGVDMTKQTYHILYDWPSQPKVMPPFWPRIPFWPDYQTRFPHTFLATMCIRLSGHA
jgi:hypothetical protein